MLYDIIISVLTSIILYFVNSAALIVCALAPAVSHKPIAIIMASLLLMVNCAILTHVTETVLATLAKMLHKPFPSTVHRKSMGFDLLLEVY